MKMVTKRFALFFEPLESEEMLSYLTKLYKEKR
jgi:hypothetical protein